MKRYGILHTIETGGPGGAETVFVNLVTRLNRDRFRSVVLVPGDGWLNQELRRRGIEAVLQHQPGRYPFRQMVNIVKNEGINLIHSHLPDQNVFSALVGFWTSRKSVVTYHGALDSTVKSAIKLWFVRSLSTASVGVSDFLTRSMKSAGFDEEKTWRIYNGVDLERFAPSGDASVHRELNLQASTKLVGMVANVRSSKGYNYFVHAASIVLKRFPDARFLAIGDVDKAIGEQLRLLIENLELQEKFLLLGFRPDIPSVLRQLDVFVLSSTSEGFSLATVEAMAAARAIVVTRSGGPEEIVDSGRTGLMVPTADSRALAAAICDLLGDPARAAILGKAARTEVENRFSLQSMIAEYESLYLHCLEGFDR